MTTPVATALVGYGYWGANLARNIAVAGSTRLVGIADDVDSRREQAATAHPASRTWHDLDEVLEDDEVEAVVLATPAGLHEEMAGKAIDAGRHVLVEKPLALTVRGADELVRAAGDAGVTLMVGHTFLYSAPVLRLKEYVEAGELGSIQYLYSQRLSLGRIRRDCNALWNFAPHDISIMLYLLDEVPSEVSARGFSFIGAGIDDVCFATLSFASGIGASIHVSWIDPRKTRLLTVVGDEKMAVYDDVTPDQKLWLVDSGVARSPEGFGEYQSLGEFQWKTRVGDIHIPHLAMTEPLRDELSAFGAAVRSGQPPRSDGPHGASVVRVLAAMDRSAAEGGSPVAVEP